MSINIGNFFVQSKVGAWTVHRQTGLIVSMPHKNGDPLESVLEHAYSGNTPLMFDIDGWKKKNWSKRFWSEPMELGCTIDIMSIGLWYRDKNGDIQYEGPAT